MTGARRAGAVGIALGLAVLAGCGGSSPKAPLVAAPSLGDSLTQVDSSISQHRYQVSRQQLDALVSRALAANRAGRLTSAQTNRILAAAARLKSALPAPPPAPKPKPKPVHRAAPRRHARPAPRHHESHHGWRQKIARARHYLEHHHHSGGDEQ